MHREEWYSALSFLTLYVWEKERAVFKNLLFAPQQPLTGSFTFAHSQVSFFIYKIGLIIYNLPIICFVRSHGRIECPLMARDCGTAELFEL